MLKRKKEEQPEFTPPARPMFDMGNFSVETEFGAGAIKPLLSPVEKAMQPRGGFGTSIEDINKIEIKPIPKDIPMPDQKPVKSIGKLPKEVYQIYTGAGNIPGREYPYQTMEPQKLKVLGESGNSYKVSDGYSQFTVPKSFVANRQPSPEELDTIRREVEYRNSQMYEKKSTLGKVGSRVSDVLQKTSQGITTPSELTTGSDIGNKIADIIGGVAGFGAGSGAIGMGTALAKGVSALPKVAAAGKITKGAVEGAATMLPVSIQNQNVQGNKPMEALKNVAIETTIGGILGGGIGAVAKALTPAATKTVPQKVAKTVLARKTPLKAKSAGYLPIKTLAEAPTLKPTTLQGTKKFKNVRYNKAVSEYESAVDSVKNKFMSSQLRKAEEDKIKSELGIDLDRLVSNMEKYDKPTAQILKENLKSSQMKRVYGLGSEKYYKLQKYISKQPRIKNKAEISSLKSETSNYITQQQKVSSTPLKNDLKATPVSNINQTSKKNISELDSKINELSKAFEKTKNIIQNNKLLSNETKQKDIKALAMKFSAEKRALIQGNSMEPVEGGLTSKELAAKVAREKGNYIGKKVLTPDGEGSVVKNAYGKIGVKNGATGEVKYYTATEVKPLKFEAKIEEVIKSSKPNTKVATVGDYLQGEQVRKLYAPVLDTEIRTVSPSKGKAIVSNGMFALENGKPVILVNPKSTKPISDVILEESAHAMRNLKGRTTGNIAAEVEAGGLKAYAGTKFEQSADKMAAYAKTLDTGVKKELGVIKSVKASPQFSAEVKSQVKGTYQTQANKELTKEAENLIKSDYNKAYELAKSGDKSSLAVETTRQLIKKFQDEGKHAQAVDLVEEVAQKALESGRSIQAFSLWGNLSEEGLLKYAQKIISKANNKIAKMSKLDIDKLSTEIKKKYGLDIKYYSLSNQIKTLQKLINLTDEDAAFIRQLHKSMKDLPDSYEKRKYIAKFMKHFYDKVPVGIGRKVATIQTMGQLLNPVTSIRNIVSNLAYAGIRNIDELNATLADKIVSGITKTRTTFAPSLKTQTKGFKKGFKEGKEDVRLGIDTSGAPGQYDLPTTRAFKAGILSKFEKALSYSLRPADRAFFNAAYDDAIARQLRAAKTTKVTDDMIANAAQEGMEATFQDVNALSKKAIETKKWLNMGKDFGLGDIILKYPRVPSNILMRSIEHSPYSLFKGSLELSALLRGQKFDQRKFAKSMGQALTGLELGATALGLYKMGLLTGSKSDKPTEKNVETAMNKSAYSLNVTGLFRFINSGFKPTKPQDGDKFVNFDWLAPSSVPIQLGANLGTTLSGEDTFSWLGLIANSIESAASTLGDQSLVTNLARYATGNTTEEKIVNFLKESTKSIPASFIPTILGRARNIVDTEQRSVKSTAKGSTKYFEEMGNLILNKLPGLSTRLAKNVNIAGETKQLSSGATVAGVLNSMFNPAFVNTYKEDVGMKFVYELYKTTGETSVLPKKAQSTIRYTDDDDNKQEVKLTNEQLASYQEKLGKRSLAAIKELIPELKSMSNKEQVKEIASALSEIGKELRSEITGRD